MSFPRPRYITNDGFRLAVYEVGPKSGQTLVFVHGWPEIAYSWKHQFEAFSKAGFHVVAIDVRGFGHSDAPKGVEHYGISQIVGDIEALLEDIDAKDVVMVGHDWGGIVVWHCARMLQDRVSHVISLCTPHVKRAPVDPIEIFRKRHGDEHYFVHFKDRPGEADALFAQDPDAFFRLMFRKASNDKNLGSVMFHTPARVKMFIEDGAPNLGGSVMPEAERRVYTEAYEKSGFHGGINLYRNTTANWKLIEGLSETVIQPTLMISAQNDAFLPPETTEHMGRLVPDLERHIIPDCGHWVTWEAPEEANALMFDWLSRRL